MAPMAKGQVEGRTQGMRSEASSVCLVDDDPLVLSSLRHLLASDGIAAHSFDKAETFLAHIEPARRARRARRAASYQIR
jgi:hypothetical protein